jgi:hypothetical protein
MVFAAIFTADSPSWFLRSGYAARRLRFHAFFYPDCEENSLLQTGVGLALCGT